MLDRLEYQYHQKLMNYPENLKTAIENGLEELISLYKSGSSIFNSAINYKYHNDYEELIKYELEHQDN